MSLLYAPKTDDLHTLLQQAGAEHQPATLLIPDLQRPYVWEPGAVIRLVDSLLRGWPFGTLLLWSFGHRPTDQVQIPSRRFWREPDRTEVTEGLEVSAATVPMDTPCRMVLDGQQRLQSLLLAIGGDDWGFRLRDRDWADVLEQPMSKGRNTKQLWTRSQLCLDVDAYIKALEHRTPESLDYVPLLKWVNTLAAEGTDGASPKNYQRPLPALADPANHGKYVRLSKLWRVTAKTGLQQQMQDVQHLLPGRSDDVVMAVLDFVTSLADIRRTQVSYLEIVQRPNGMGESVYNDAIVNIFTRLNTAGRALTHEEITFAWIKSLWPTPTPSATQLFDTLHGDLREHVALGKDDLVQSVAAIWSVLERGGKLLERGDLLKGDVMRPVVADIARRWDDLQRDLPWVVGILESRGLRHQEQFLSLASLTAVWAWCAVARAWNPEGRLGSFQGKQFWAEIEAVIARHADRWLTVTSWAGRWRDTRGLERYSIDLAKRWSSIRDESSKDAVLKNLEGFFTDWIQESASDAKATIQRLEVSKRDRVREYFVPLWIWHRLDKDRWSLTDEQLARVDAKARIEWQVDHVVPHKWWTDNARTPEDPDPGNDLGNCALLKSNFNLAKQMTPVRTFLSDEVTLFVKDPERLERWAKALLVTDALLDATAKPPAEVQAAVDVRTEAIRMELCDFIDGARSRQDL